MFVNDLYIPLTSAQSYYNICASLTFVLSSVHDCITL